MPPLPGRTLLSAQRIQDRVRALARSINRHYRKQPVTVIGLMNGSLFFMVDLLRLLPADTRLECWRVASYLGRRSTGKIQGLDSLQAQDYAGRHLLVIDDILDTGLTLDAVCQSLRTRRPASLEMCVLLSKNVERIKPIRPRWVGFEIPDRFVIGYGLDHDHRHRCLPMIRALDHPAPRC